MAKKEDIFGKLNMKDYNNQLEEILENKKFSSDTKNILLSMLYKIELAYNDYSTVKVYAKPRGEFIENILHIIRNYCNEIKLVKPIDEEFKEFKNKKEKCIVDNKNKSIICEYNEQSLLYSIFKLDDSSYKFEDDYIGKALNEMFLKGKNINAKEVIRDFDGWAWNTNISSIEDINCNLIYQNILLLIGENFKSENDLNKKLNKISKDNAKKIYILISRIALLMYIEEHSDELNSYKKYKKEIDSMFKVLDNKELYFSNITENIKKLVKKLKVIDKCLSDTDYLKRQYLKYNRELDNDKKIDVKEFIKNLQNESKRLNIKIQQYNIKMLPSTYARDREKLSDLSSILKALNSKSNIDDYILKLQKYFIKAIQDKIASIETRNEIMDIIFVLRYYNYLPYKDGLIKDSDELKKMLEQIQQITYDKMYKLNALNMISIIPKVNNEVTSVILDTKIINLKNIDVLIKAEDYQIVIKVYDEDNIEKVLEYNTIEGMTAKRNKKFRLFIK